MNADRRRPRDDPDPLRRRQRVPTGLGVDARPTCCKWPPPPWPSRRSRRSSPCLGDAAPRRNGGHLHAARSATTGSSGSSPGSPRWPGAATSWPPCATWAAARCSVLAAVTGQPGTSDPLGHGRLGGLDIADAAANGHGRPAGDRRGEQLALVTAAGTARAGGQPAASSLSWRGRAGSPPTGRGRCSRPPRRSGQAGEPVGVADVHPSGPSGGGAVTTARRSPFRRPDAWWQRLF